MTYATQQDLIDRFGQVELARLTDRVAATTIDATVVGRALADADALIDGYVGAVYVVPLSPVPDIIRKFACDIARYSLHDDAAPEKVRKDFEDARRSLEAIAKGQMQLPGAAVSQTSATPGGAPSFESDERVFTDAALQGLRAMTGVRAEIAVNADPLAAAFARLREAGADLREPLHAIGGAMADSTVERFETERDPAGRAWPRSERALKDGGKTLNLTGALKLSFNTPSAVQADQDSVSWGTNIVYAAAHQFGVDDLAVVSTHDRTIRQAFGQPLDPPRKVSVETFVKRMFLPSRPFLGVDDADIEVATEILTEAWRQATGNGALGAGAPP